MRAEDCRRNFTASGQPKRTAHVEVPPLAARGEAPREFYCAAVVAKGVLSCAPELVDLVDGSPFMLVCEACKLELARGAR